MKNPLERLDLFQNMSTAKIEEVLAHPRWVPRRLSPGEFINLGGRDFTSLSILEQGRVESTLLSAGGRVLSLGDRTAPALIAPAPLFGTFPGALTIEAKTSGLIRKINRDSAAELLASHPVFLNNFLRICANSFNYLSRRVVMLHLPTIRLKIAHYLLEKDESAGSPFPLSRSLTSLADFMGVERPSLSAVYHQMIREGLFHREGKLIFLDDREALRALMD